MGEEEAVYRGKYLGGHAMYPPSNHNVHLLLHPEELVVYELDLHIPYSGIKEIKNASNVDITKIGILTRNVIIWPVWKKKETYLCIVYNDGIQDQNPVFKLENLEEAQREIYKH
jgi:hypothetical protein